MRGDGGCILLSLVFYKICTKIIHNLYAGLRFRLVYMECREPRHNRHTVSLLTDHIVVSPKVSRTRNRYAQPDQNPHHSLVKYIKLSMNL